MALVMAGTYNAVIINMDSMIDHEHAHYKRIDEVYGVVTPGRSIAATSTWKKLEQPGKAQIKQSPMIVEKTEIKQVEQTEQKATIEQELDLALTQVINPQKWATALTAGQFSGNLKTNNGTIESLSISLNGEEDLHVSFVEITGNVFEYEHNGETLSGLLYQVDNNSYMVTLSNGPLEGTRLQFSVTSNPEMETVSDETQEVAAASPVEFETVSFHF